MSYTFSRDRTAELRVGTFIHPTNVPGMDSQYGQTQPVKETETDELPFCCLYDV